MQDKFNHIVQKYTVLIIILTGLIAYFNVLFNGFTGDDIGQIVNYQPVHSLGSFFSFFGRISSINAYYRPMMYAAYSVIYSIFGQHAFPFHLFSICLVLLNAVLVYYLFSNFFGRHAAFLLSLFFIVVPINAEVAESIAAFQDLFFMMFGLIALLLSIRKKLDWRFLVGINLLILLSLLSKETGFVFVLVIPLYAYLFNRFQFKKISIASTLAFLEYLFFRLVIAHFVFALPSEFIPIGRFSLIQRAMSIPKIIVHYLVTFFWPVHLATWQIWVVSQFTFKDFWLHLIIVIACTALLCVWGRWIYKKDKPKFGIFLFFSIWFLLALGMHLQIIALDATVADRWFYLPSIGLFGLICLATQRLILYFEDKKCSQYMIIGTVILYAVFVLFSIRTIIRNTDFRNNIRLFQHDCEVTNSSLMENALGIELENTQQYASASEHLQKAVALSPQIWQYWYNLGGYYIVINNDTQAESAFLHAASLTLSPSITASAYSATLIKDNDYSQAIDYSNSALQKYPKDPGLLLTLSVAYYDLNNIPQAGNYLEQSYDIEPSTQVYYIYAKINDFQPVAGDYLIKSFLNIN